MIWYLNCFQFKNPGTSNTCWSVSMEHIVMSIQQVIDLRIWGSRYFWYRKFSQHIIYFYDDRKNFKQTIVKFRSKSSRKMIGTIAFSCQTKLSCTRWSDSVLEIFKLEWSAYVKISRPWRGWDINFPTYVISRMVGSIILSAQGHRYPLSTLVETCDSCSPADTR